MLFVNSVSCWAAPKAKMIDFWNDSEPLSQLNVNHDAWTKILERYVEVNDLTGVNRFDYGSVSGPDRQALLDYIDLLQGMEPRQLNELSQKAFWLNLYNATVVSIVLSVKPENTIKDVPKLWKEKRLNIILQPLSLDDIEHGILRPLYNDPRIHFALTPATMGSGDILPVAYTGNNIEELLELNTINFFNRSDKRVRVEDDRLILSSIFKWYKKDFGGDSKSVKSFIGSYAGKSLRDQIDETTSTIYKYDWSLNKP